MTQGFSISEAFRAGWRMWKLHWVFLLGIFLFALILPAIPRLFQYALSSDAVIAQAFLGLLHLFLTVVAQMGLLTISVKIARGIPCTFADFFSTIYLFPSYFLGWILFYLAVLGGLILLIIPGIILALKFCLWPYFVLDQSHGGIEALKASNRTVYGSKWDLLLFSIAAVFLNILGVLCLGVGFLITMPVTLLAWAHIYLQLQTSEGVSI